MRLQGMTLLAIDLGKSGGIAYTDTDGSVHAVAMPDTVADVERLLRTLVCVDTTCFIEEIPMYRGKMNLRSTAVLFRNFGQIEGVLASLKCRVEYLKPDWWQKALRLGKSADHGDRWKAHLKGRAQALFPRVDVTLKTADALLILEAGRMHTVASKSTNFTNCAGDGETSRGKSVIEERGVLGYSERSDHCGFDLIGPEA